MTSSRPGAQTPPAAAASAQVFALDLTRIERALAHRGRYRYVRPRVVAEGPGWKIVSPNCSRNVDADGGEIDIAWFVPEAASRWQLHARDHVRGCWVLKAGGLTLDAALSHVCADPAREFWA